MEELGRVRVPDDRAQQRYQVDSVDQVRGLLLHRVAGADARGGQGGEELPVEDWDGQDAHHVRWVPQGGPRTSYEPRQAGEPHRVPLRAYWS